MTAVLLGWSAGAFGQTDFSVWTDAQKEDFLRNGEVLSTERIGTGITGTHRAKMRMGAVEHDAHIQTVDEFKQMFQGSRGTELNFRDTYKFNIAAYRLDRLIGFRNVPVSIERKVHGDTASVTWWVDDVLMMELDRFEKKIEPPNKEDWNDQMYNVRVFNELVYNTDPNLGNFLITKDWRIRMIDFTRAFRTHRTLKDWKNIEPHIDRRVYEGLKNLSEEAVQSQLGELLRKSEIRGLMGRRDELVEYFDRMIAERGRNAVVCSKPGH